MENRYRIGISLFPNLNSDRHSDSVISFRLKVEYSIIFDSKRSDTTQIFFIVIEIRRTA